MTEQRTDWVEVWQGLHGSRDWAAIISAGQQLCNGLITARIAWRTREDSIRAEHAELTAERDALHDQLVALDDDDRAVSSVVRAWHDYQHATVPWMVCPHVVCRAVVLSHPEVLAVTRADVLLERAS